MSKEKTDFSARLKHVEDHWKDQLFHHTQSVFKTSDVPSHNEWHHLRVWKYAKEILYNINLQGVEISSSEILELMMAVFFHDTGLSLSEKEDHGKFSREICEEFLARENIQTQINTNKILKAIEYHDDKTYVQNSPLVEHQKVNIAGVLNIADDLDAFGIIGVYRYSEIYLLRGVEPENLSEKVIPNLKNRFHHFIYQCFAFPHIVIINKKRYQQTLAFFEGLYEAFRSRDKSNEDHFSIKVIQLFQELLRAGNFDLKEKVEMAIEKSKSDEEKFFFRKLLEESML